MDNSLIFKFAKFSNFYQSSITVFLRALFLIALIFLLFDFANSNMQLRAPLFFLSLFLMFEIFLRQKVERYPPDEISLKAAKILVKQEIIPNLFKEKSVQFFLKKCEIEEKELPIFNITPKSLFISAKEIVKKQNLPLVFLVDIMVAYLLQIEEQSKLLFSKKLKTQDLANIAHWAKVHYSEEVKKAKVKVWGRGIGEEWVTGWTLETQKYTLDFTKKALRQNLGFYGRENELNSLINVLLKSAKTNVVLVGPPGVGKTTIVRALAVKLFLGDVPTPLLHKRVLELSVGALLSGSETQGELEQRVENIIAELTHSGDIVLFIPEIQNIAGATTLKFDATGVLLPFLKGERVQVIATSTRENYKAFIEPKTTFADTFEKIEVSEPERDECLKMLEEAALKFEKKHKINITYKAIVVAYELADKYLAYRFLPGKAINLLDEACVISSLSKRENLEEEDIINLVQEKTHVPIGTPTKKEKTLLLTLPQILHRRIIDQQEAVKTITSSLQRLRSGILLEDRPVGTFLFLGPTGVGKTETAKALAQVYFGSDETMIRIDMSEYQHENSIFNLIDILAEKVREKPFSLVLLDEFEKAHPKILDIFLQVFEDGRLTDTNGRRISFVNTIVIATSNAGAEMIREEVKRGVVLQEIKTKILDKILRLGAFKPELLNRFDSIVLFEPLGKKEIREVTRLLLSKLANNLKEKDIEIKFDDSLVAKIAQDAFDPTLGGRPLRRFIQDNLENLIAQKILKEEIKRGNIITFSTDITNNITLSVS